MDDLTRDLIYKEGLSEKEVFGKYEAQVVLRKRDRTDSGKEVKRQMQAGIDEIKKIPNLSELKKELKQEKANYKKISEEVGMLRFSSGSGSAEVHKQLEKDIYADLEKSRIRIAELENTIKERKQKGTQYPPDVTVVTPVGVATVKGRDFEQEKGAWVYRPKKKK